MTETTIDSETGEITMQKLDGMVNNFNTSMLEAIRCNMDIKFIGSGSLAKAALYYITDYISKSQLKLHVAFATLETALKKIGTINDEDDDVIVKAKKLLTKCANSLIGLQELSAPQVSSYVLDFEDHFTNFEFRNLYWPSFEAHLNRQLPSPDCYPSSISDASVVAADTDSSSVDDAGDEYIHVTMNDEWELTGCGNQVADYVYRGHALDELSLWDFVCQVEKQKKRNGHLQTSAPLGSDSDLDNESESDEDHCDVDILAVSTCKRPAVRLLDSHTEFKTHELIVRSPTRRFVPVPMGPSLPRRDSTIDKEKYSRLMLIVFKPWRDAMDLKTTHLSWHEAFQSWKTSADYTPEINQLLNNMNLLNECKDSRDNHFKNRNRQTTDIISENVINESRMVEDDELTTGIDEEALHDLLQDLNGRMARSLEGDDPEILNVIGCLEHSGLLNTEEESEIINVEGSIEQIGNDTESYEAEWKATYDKRKAVWKQKESLETYDYNMEPDFTANASFLMQATQHRAPQIVNNDTTTSPGAGPSNELNNHIDISHVGNIEPEDFVVNWNLNKEQALAFKIIANQSLKRKGFEDPLKMFLSGPAGTGKSRVFNALRSFFESKDQSRRFRVCSYMGIAARNVGGMTLHAALCLGQKKNGAKSKENLMSMWNGVDFLLIDEVSMISCEFLLQISEALSNAKGNSLPFRGVNVIFAGDFAQLPPFQTRLYANLKSRYGIGTTKKE